MVLPYRYFWAAKENVLSSSGFGTVLLDLDLDDIARVLDNLRDDGLMASSDLS